MNAVGKSSVVFVTLSGLFWGGWVVGSQTPEGQEALAQAYQAYATQQAVANEDLFSPTALRVVVCGGAGSGLEATEPKPCLAVVAAGKMFVVDAGAGAARSLAQRNIPLDRMDAVLLTSAGFDQSADLDALYAGAARNGDALLPVYGPAETQRLVDGLNQAAGFDGAASGLQAWGPSPEPGRPVIVYEGDGLVVSAFTTQQDAFAGRIGYRFDYRGRSIVVGGDGRVVSADAAMNADVVLQDAQAETLANLHAEGTLTAREAAAHARAANAGMLVLTGAENRMSASMQLSEARASGGDVISGRVGMVLELPLSSQAVNVRAL
ncbi:MAG: MBL fold metallo-hydrolase [Hyphomonadaceae bacterium]|nr:MBL fold metallo-hydrolase [Hyphomonadaceae bacterium]